MTKWKDTGLFTLIYVMAAFFLLVGVVGICTKVFAKDQVKLPTRLL